MTGFLPTEVQPILHHHEVKSAYRQATKVTIKIVTSTVVICDERKHTSSDIGERCFAAAALTILAMRSPPITYHWSVKDNESEINSRTSKKDWQSLLCKLCHIVMRETRTMIPGKFQKLDDTVIANAKCNQMDLLW